MKIQRRKVIADMDRKIVIGMIVSTQFLKSIQPVFKTEYLQGKCCTSIARWCLEFLEKYDRAPGKGIQDIFHHHQRNGLDGTTSDLIENLLASLSGEFERSKELNTDYLVDEAFDYFKKRQLEIFHEDFEHYLERNEIEEAERLFSEFKPIKQVKERSKGYTAEELMNIELPEIRWVIDGIIREGLTLFAGKPKVGKSYFLLNAAIDVASGDDAFGCIPTESATVLYLALEDPIARIKDRLVKMGIQNPSKLFTVYPLGEWPRVHEGGMEQLEEWMQDHPDTRLIIIDTLERFKKPQKAPGYHYSEDYQCLKPLHEFANKHHIGVIVVHHTKKTATKDPFDEFSGTTGLTAVPDTLAKLDRAQSGKEGRIFAFRSKDAGEEEFLFRFDGCRYELSEEEAEQYEGSKSRQTIFRYLKLIEEPIKRKDLVTVMEKWGVGKGIDVLLEKMVNEGAIQKIGYGMYAHKDYEDDSWRDAVIKKLRERRRSRHVES